MPRICLHPFFASLVSIGISSSSPAWASEWKNFIPNIAKEFLDHKDATPWEDSLDDWEDATAGEDWQKYIPDFAKTYVLGGKKTASHIYYGPTFLSNTSLKDLEVMGPLSLEDSKVKRMLKVYGPVEGDNIQASIFEVHGPASVKDKSKVGKVTINGFLHIKDSLVTGPVSVNGPIVASRTTFKGKISVASTKISFKDCVLQSLYIRPSYEVKNKAQHVYLKGKTTIYGDITFASGQGKLTKDDTVVIKGRVMGVSKNN